MAFARQSGNGREGSPSSGTRAVLSPQNLGSLDDGRELCLSVVRWRNGVVSKRREAAVGRQQNTVRAQNPDGSSSLGDDICNAFNLASLLIHDAHADSIAGRKILEHFDVTPARGVQSSRNRVPTCRLLNSRRSER